jgi:hypothetical protein
MALPDSSSTRISTSARGIRALRSIAVSALACWCFGACSSEDVVVAEQCPSPLDSRATIDPGMDAGLDAGVALIYGTSCAPCVGGTQRLDSRGCPIFVTFESCGGDICFGPTLVTRPEIDAGTDPLETDAGDTPEDAGDQT